MRYLLSSIILLFLLLIPILSYAEERKELIPSYEITKNEIDSSLTNKEATFVFTFKNIPWPAKIKSSCNEIRKTIFTTSKGKYSLKIVPGEYTFQFYYNDEFYETYTDFIQIKPGYRMEINVNFESSLYPVISDKPVIYVYPKETTHINIKLGLKGEFLFTYPNYNKGWDFEADPNGTIYLNNKEYQYLFWDAKTQVNATQVKWHEGFIVDNKDLTFFLEKKLDEMGLNPKESEDFITYWVPRMNANEKNYIHFLFNEDYNQFADISITPKPDNLFRVYMLWKNAEGLGLGEMKFKEQVIPSFRREGFTVVEWGGSQLGNITPVTVSK